MKKLILIAILICGSIGCSPQYFSPEKSANPRHEFEAPSRKYKRELRRYQRKERKTIDPLRWN